MVAAPKADFRLPIFLSLWFCVPLADAGRPPRTGETPSGAGIEGVLSPYRPTGPRIEYRAVLPRVMLEAIKAYDSGFVMWGEDDYPEGYLRSYLFSFQSSPSVVIGDFNGDGKADAVLAGRDIHGPAILAALSSGATSYMVIRIPTPRDGFFDAARKSGMVATKMAFNILSFQPKGKRYDLGGDTTSVPILLRTDAFENAQLDAYYLNKYSTSDLCLWSASKAKFLCNDLE